MAQVTSLSLIGTPSQVHSFGVAQILAVIIEALQVYGSIVEAAEVS